MNRDTYMQNSRTFLAKFLPALLLDVAAAIRTLQDETGIIRNQMETHNRSENVAVAWDALHDTTPLTCRLRNCLLCL
jgi:hypothetical protein